MNNLAVKEVDFHGDKLYAAHNEFNDKTYVAVRWVCDGIGLTKDQMKRQIKNIRDDLVLSKGVSNLTLPTNGGEQNTICIELDFLPLWLAKISITPTMQKDNPETVNKLIKYQLEAKDVLARAFIKSPTGFDVLRGMLDKIEESNKKVDLLTLRQEEIDKKVVNMQDYLTKSPDRKTIQHSINEYARIHNMRQSDVRSMVNRKLEDKYGIDINRRIKSGRKKINEDRINKGQKPYSESTLQGKYNGMDVIIENGYAEEMMKILAGMQ